MIKIKILIFFVIIISSCQKNEVNILPNEFNEHLLVNVNPFQTFENEFEYFLDEKENRITYYLYIGKPVINLVNSNNDSVKIQFNDKLGDSKEIIDFLSCTHCENVEKILLIHADKNIPIKYLRDVECKTQNYINNISIYYLFVNKEYRRYGYNSLETVITN